MTPVAENLEPPPAAATPQEEPQSVAPPPEVEQAPLTPARVFLERINLIQRLQPIRELNLQLRLPHPFFDDAFKAVEENPDVLKRFLKLANGSWFNSRVQVDSPYMAFTRFGTEGFCRLTLAAFVADAVGELSTRFKIWPHLEAVARTGELLAQKLAPNLIDEVFAAGLLHDAVVPPMQRELQDYLYFLECALNMDPIVTGLELRCHDFDHAQAAGELTRALEFEPAIVEVVSAHHNESMSSVSEGNARSILGILLTTKRTISLAHGHKKNAFETATEKALLREISTALGVSSGRVIHAVADVADVLKVQETILFSAS